MDDNLRHPRVITAEECDSLFLEYISFLSGVAATRMWRARVSLWKYYDSEELPFGYFHAANSEELNLQVQWKIASCYAAAMDENDDFSMAEALGLIDDMEWFGYELINATLAEGDKKWPFIIILVKN